MKRHGVIAGSAVVFSLVVGLSATRVAAAQTPSLGDVAKKEAERRKTQPPAPGKVYTNKDLPESAQKPATATPAAAAEENPKDPVAVATEQKAADASADKAKGEAYWKKRMADAREELRRNEVFVGALQTRVNTLNRDFASRDNPAQRSRIAEDRTEAATELARVKAQVERSKKEIADLEEEARKSGVPPGWLR
jgi:hypothetical protein